MGSVVDLKKTFGQKTFYFCKIKIKIQINSHIIDIDILSNNVIFSPKKRKQNHTTQSPLTTLYHISKYIQLMAKELWKICTYQI